MRWLTCTKLVLTCVKKALGNAWTYKPPAASSSELTSGRTAILACSGGELMKSKFIVQNLALNTPPVGTDASKCAKLPLLSVTPDWMGNGHHCPLRIYKRFLRAEKPSEDINGR